MNERKRILKLAKEEHQQRARERRERDHQEKKRITETSKIN